ncbi:Ger(x)C family spore germination protein [Paenibacillus sp. tmac-D7]|uniref:Ger(x)C family spore germination protein n=1 Tax=Paenibacillus sp. tmac-D7 TaxID=2591462 RepID=UPI001142B8E4|nr:Ger(x)C family spore germination protein [Paenibacillus sp. tmac-D7]
MIRTWSRFGLLATAILLLPGCWDRTEVNDLAFILSTALDIEKDGSIRYSVMVPLPGSMGGATGGGGGTAGDKSYYIDSEVGKTYREAQAKLQNRMPRRMFLAHRRTVLIGEQLAKAGVFKVFDATSRSPESRMTTYFIVTKGKAYELLQASPQFERFPSEAIRELAKSKVIIDMNMKDFALALSSPGGDPVAIYMGVRESEKGTKPSKEVEVLGYSQFRGDKMVDTLEGRAAAGLALLKERFVNVSITLHVENTDITVRIFEAHSDVQARLAGNQLQFDINLITKAKLLESTGTQDFTRADQIHLMEARLAEQMKKSVEDTLKQMIDNNCDSVQLGAYVWRAYPNLWTERFKNEWPNGLKTAKFNIKVKSILSETGMIYDNVTKSEDAE